jgi:glycerol-3-phosphate dehydrogenase
MPVRAATVAVIGGGVVGCAVAHALARRGVQALVLEAESGLALGASGTNSGILHTGFDSEPGTLETRLILRAAVLRDQLLDELGVTYVRCGARLSARTAGEHDAVAALLERAGVNSVEAACDGEGSLRIPGESITDPVAFVHALAGAALGGGAKVLLNACVVALRERSGAIELTLADGGVVQAEAAVNCAGLFADDVAALADERPVQIYPRKGEFLVFRPPEPLTEIILPVPSALGKGVLVFPTVVEGLAIAGPTAREREDKHDWTVEPDATALICERARSVYPPLARAELVDSYAGLRPAGRAANYVIEPSRALPRLLHVAAIRSTGLSASLAIGEHVACLLAERAAIELGAERALPAAPDVPAGEDPRWWRRAARYHESAR